MVLLMSSLPSMVPPINLYSVSLLVLLLILPKNPLVFPSSYLSLFLAFNPIFVVPILLLFRFCVRFLLSLVCCYLSLSLSTVTMIILLMESLHFFYLQIVTQIFSFHPIFLSNFSLLCLPLLCLLILTLNHPMILIRYHSLLLDVYVVIAPIISLLLNLSVSLILDLVLYFLYVHLSFFQIYFALVMHLIVLLPYFYNTTLVCVNLMITILLLLVSLLHILPSYNLHIFLLNFYISLTLIYVCLYALYPFS